MIFLSAMLALGAATQPTSATAQASTQPRPGTARAADKIICRKPDPNVGTRLAPKRTCLKKSDWDAQAREFQTSWENRPRVPSGDVED